MAEQLHNDAPPRRVSDYDFGVLRADVDTLMRMIERHISKEEEDAIRKAENDLRQSKEISELRTAVQALVANMSTVDTLNETIRGLSFIRKLGLALAGVFGSLYAGWLFLKEHGISILSWLHIK